MPRNKQRFEVELDLMSRPRHRPRWVLRIAIVLVSLIAACVFAAPWFLATPSVVNYAVQRFGGLEPLQIQVGGISIGWLSPASVQDVRVMDHQGTVLVTVQNVSTEKGIISWIREPLDIGKVSIKGVEADIMVADGSTNLETALSELLSDQQVETTDSRADKPLAGSIVLSDAKLRLRQADLPQEWLVDVPVLSVELPTASQLLGPIELKAIFSEVSGSVSDSVGQVLAKAEQAADGSIELRAKLDNLSLDVWNVVRSRLPWIPVMGMTGHTSGVLAGNARDAENWTFELQQIQVLDFEISAPEIIGAIPAKLNRIAAGGKVSLLRDRLQLDDTQLVCDVGNLNATASLPWPLTPPSPGAPIVSNAAFTASGNLDLPQLVRAAESLLPMREDVQLTSGRVQFTASQQPRDTSELAARVQLTFSDMQAQSAGQQISWNEPLSVDLMAIQQASELRFELGTSAEFCDLKGSGNYENGQLAGNVNLDLLHRRLSQFMELPVSTMTGSASINFRWNMDAQQLVAADGTLEMTPIVVATKSGTEMREPAWNGKFNARSQFKDGKPHSINSAHLEFIASEEQLVADLHEPVSIAIDGSDGALPPAAFNVSMSGDLANWKRRGWVWLNEPPEIDISGQIQMAVSGRLDSSHIEILQANWDSKPVSLRTADFALAEPQMIGNFKGRVDTADLTRLQIEQLTVQANSLWIVAQDQSAENGTARSGQARWMVDIERFMQNLQAANRNRLASSSGANSVLTSSSNSPSAVAEYQGKGTLQGGLNWLVGQQGARFSLQANGENVAAFSRSAGNPEPTILWSEPSLSSGIEGTWTAQDGSIDLSSLQLKTQWMDYFGKLAYVSTQTTQEITSDGQANVDTAQLSTKLQPFIGRNVQLSGQQTVPVNVRWTRDLQSSAPAMAGLQATSRLGWKQANVIGIDIGEADVPVVIENGILASAAEIPVSGGKLRWDISSDLTQDLLAIVQKPMVVLENVAITPEMCSGWLKYVAPLVAETTSIDGRLSLSVNEARLMPTHLAGQTVDGQLMMHHAVIGPGPLANEITGLIRQIEAIRRADPSQATNPQNRTWVNLPEQQIAFRMVEGKVYHRDTQFSVGDATLSTSGYVDVAGQIEMLVALPIPEAWTQRGPVLASLRGQTLQFPLRGNVTRPQLDASLLGQLGRQTIENAAQNLLQQGINRGLEKLFRQ